MFTQSFEKVAGKKPSFMMRYKGMKMMDKFKAETDMAKDALSNNPQDKWLKKRIMRDFPHLRKK